MSHEYTHTSTLPETLADATDIGDALYANEMAANTLTSEHDERLAAVVSNHDTVLQTGLRNPGASNVEPNLLATAKSVTDAAENSVKGVNAQLYEAAMTVPSFLSSDDQMTLHTLRDHAQKNGVNDGYVQFTLFNIQDLVAQAGMRASLDYLALMQARQLAQTFGIADPLVQNRLNTASTPAIRAAMVASLDGIALGRARDIAKSKGAGDPAVLANIETASTDHAQAALKAAFDIVALNQARHAKERHGSDSRLVDLRLSGASSPNARKLLRTMVLGADAQPESSADIDIDNVVDTVVRGNRSYGWLKGTDPSAIRQVIDDVLTLRAAAKAKGEAITDRDVYIHFRKANDPSLSEGSSDAQRALFTIIDAMMSGSLKGKLPF